LGLWHSWSMFAPQPILVSRCVVVEYVLIDGTVQRNPEIRMQDLSIWQALLDAHERKYQDNLAGSDYKAHRLAICNYAADRFVGDPKQLERVDLILEKTRIPQPSADAKTNGSSCQRTVLWSVRFF
jgi:hypothetical protein